MVLVQKPKRAVPAHHKRRHGQHHRRDEHYSKPYWPYLPIGLIIGLGVVLNAFWGTVSRGVLGYATEMSISELLTQTNNQRTSNSLGALAINATLNQAAQAKANDMAARDYWSHNTPEGNPPWVFFTDAGYEYQTAGENLAYGFDTSAATVTAWMNSPAHRDNILNGTYKEIGFGIAQAPSYQGTGPETIVVAMYGSQKSGAVAAAPAAPTPTPTPAPSPAPAPAAPVPAPVEEKPAEPQKPEANQTAAAPVADAGITTPKATSQEVSRIQLISGSSASWSAFVVSVIAGVALVIFFLRHGLFWHRMLVKGEKFVIHHKFLDIALVAVAVIGIILTRSAGIIH